MNTDFDRAQQYNSVKGNHYSVEARTNFMNKITNSNTQTDTPYDVGIVGFWNGANYGSVLTYFALNTIINEMGYRTVMLNQPVLNKNNVYQNPRTYKFVSRKFNISDYYYYNELDKLNKLCHTFVLGADQVFARGCIIGKEQFYLLDFAYDDKKKIAYASSFGHKKILFKPNEREMLRYRLSRFDYLSVREFDGIENCKALGATAVFNLDPAFVCDKKHYDMLVQDSKLSLPDKYILAYILDPNESIRQALLYAEEKLGCTVKVILDAHADFETNKQKLNLDDRVLEIEEIEDWFSAFAHSSFVITDSFHGTCMSIINQKNFISIANPGRGTSRTDTLKQLLHIDSKIIDNADEILSNPTLFDDVDYNSINAILEKQKAISKNWLYNALIAKQKHKVLGEIIPQDMHYRNEYEAIKNSRSFKLGRMMTYFPRKLRDILKGNKPNDSQNTANDGTPAPVPPAKPQTNVAKQSQGFDVNVMRQLETSKDFKNVRMLVTLLRDYGIKHVVLSPGGRDVPIIRMFEYNESNFVLHRVTDERSAAYYAMGIAMQLNAPVACVCTSGTAASNYLPAVTEAYYTGVPLIVITADRYQVYLNHGEDQTIPQKNIYKDVIKMSISLPEDSTWLADYQTRRDIQTCILEATHNGNGPVHINVPIINNVVGSKLSKAYWQLLPRVSPHIQRVSCNNINNDLIKWVDELKKWKRIILVYGQSAPATDEERHLVEAFAQKFNCVVLADYIANLNCKYALNAHNMLLGISQDEFNAELSPDIIISVGGKRLMNDPLTTKIRHGRGNIRHWSVMPDGKVKDFYFKLTSVIECDKNYFFKYFVENAGKVANDGSYLQKWQSYMAKYSEYNPQNFTSLYIYQKFLPTIPQNSILHLGVGQTFIECRRYFIDPTVKVYCNMGTNGIDGCTSTFMGQTAIVNDELCYLLVGDLSFFYDMNGVWNKELKNNIRILMINNNGSGLLRSNNLKAVTSVHNAKAEGWIKSLGFDYISASTKEEFEEKLKYFNSKKPKKAVFFEVFCQ